MGKKSLFNIGKLKKSSDLEFFALDIIMLLLVTANLLLIVFEWVFTYQIIQDLLKDSLPVFFDLYYTNIHTNFIIIDLVFVAIFISELLFRWGIAIYRKTYHSWIFYPFIHWYDVLGCIPLGGFRFLRVLRVFSMVYRLERMGVINLSESWLFKQLKRYYQIFLEEVSDRVVVNIIDGVKAELEGGSPISNKIVGDVLVPQKEEITSWVSDRVDAALSSTYQLHRDEIKKYIDELMVRALEKNKEVMTLELVPVLGSYLTSRVEKLISDIVFNVINEAVEDIANHRDKAVEEIAELVFDGLLHTSQDEKFNKFALSVVSETLDIVKDKVKEKQWKISNDDNSSS
ncbi:hypothetical protein [Chondrinema litorale]|uniref:hypothetical protein n=1 Tax=Chondrinema litorale TaxID=2994555 RepID=UPI002542DBD5|nr:hypothetical protein [Chondrinema litorale]UZR92375.1 hypothetical protein OQ292_10935 [Chondrinema litorale]